MDTPSPQVIYLIRHASPDWNDHEKPYHLAPGPTLSPAGVQEAEKLGEYLKPTGVCHLITSPLERCMRTAHIVSTITGAQIDVDPSLCEVQPGESEDSLRIRVGHVLDEVLRDSGKSTLIALITHGSPIASLLSLLGLNDNEIRHYRTVYQNNPLPPAGAWRAVRKDRNSDWDLSLVFVPGSNNQV
jgi:broad specificity phosphatase PhoE